MKVDPSTIAEAYATLEAKSAGAKPVPVFLTPTGKILVGGRSEPTPGGVLVCRYTHPLPSLQDFTSDIEHEAALMSEPRNANPEAAVFAVLEASRSPMDTMRLAYEAGVAYNTALRYARALWKAERIGRTTVASDNGPPRKLWHRKGLKPADSPVSLPAGPDGPTRCAARKPLPGAKSCPVRNTCARHRAFTDTWNDLPDHLRATTSVQSHMCEGQKGFPHFLEIPHD